MNVIVDTSVWSVVLRRKPSSEPLVGQELKELIRDGRARMLGAIRQELLQGIRSPESFDRLRKHLAPFPDIPLITKDYEEAARMFNACRSAGVQGSSTDFLICAVASRQDMAILTTDLDFTYFARHLPLQVMHRAL